MVLNRVWLAAVGVTALAWSGLSAAQQYRADEYLKLDLARAVLSPKPLGPAESFTPGPLDVTIDRGKVASQSSAELVIDPKTVPAATVHAENNPTPKPAPKTALQTATPHTRVAHARVERATPRKRTRWSRFTGEIPARPRPAIPAFRSGHAEPAASATGSDSCVAG